MTNDQTGTAAGSAASQAVRDAADRLLDAARTRTPAPPVRDLVGATDVEAAYAVQTLVNQQRLDAGARRVGRKIGLTSPAVQAQLGVDRPDFGVLFDDMVVVDEVPVDAFLQPKVEAEVAFVLGADLADGDLDAEQVRAAVHEVVAAIEIVDSRVAGWDITFGDTVADNASSGAYVLGATRRTLADVEPRDVTMTMRVDDEVASAGTGAACLGDPLEALAWLARTSRDLGDPLRAGEVVLSGALGPMAPVTGPCTVTATVDGLGDVTVRFTDTTTSAPTPGATA